MQRHLVYFFTTSGSVRRRGAEEKRQGREPKLLQEGVPTQEECFFSPFIRFWSVRSVRCAFFRSGSFFRRSVQCIIRRRHFLNTSNSRVACSRIQVACDCSAFEFSRHSGFFSPFGPKACRRHPPHHTYVYIKFIAQKAFRCWSMESVF